MDELTSQQSVVIRQQALNCVSPYVEGNLRGETARRRNMPGTPYTYKAAWFSADCDHETRVALCRDPSGIAKANGLANAIMEGDQRSGCPRAVYVIGVVGEKTCKIGISATPVTRLERLQANHYRELYLFGTLHMAGKPKAETVEQEALRRGEAIADWRRGEWLGLEPETAFDLVIKSADDLNIRSCDAAAWIENMGNRVRALARAGGRI